MTRVMRDSVTVAAIPVEGTDIAAGYEDGSFTNAAMLLARFPGVPKVLIDVNGSLPQADVRDWETGDKAGSLEQWVIDHNAFTGRKDAVVYCNRSTIPEVRQLTGSQILGVDYWLWVATLDGTLFTPQMYPGVIACQDKGASQTGANFDESVVFADWWKPAPSVGKVQDVIILRVTDQSGATRTYVFNGTTARHVVSPADEAALSAALPVVDVSTAQLDEFTGR